MGHIDPLKGGQCSGGKSAVNVPTVVAGNVATGNITNPGCVANFFGVTV